MALRTLSLCAGVGGIDLGLRLADLGIRTVCYVEREAFCAAVLVARMADQALDVAPVWDDVATFDGRPWRGRVDCVVAGFPCQPVSLAGARKGLDDHRFIWDDIARIIGEVEPRYVFLENVPGILTADGGAFLDRVLGSLVVLGFDCEWDLFSAEETGAPHRRQRWFCLAHARQQPEHIFGRGVRTESPRGSTELADPGRSERGTSESSGYKRYRHDARWTKEADRPGGNCAVVGDAEPRRDRVYPPVRNDHAGWAAGEASLEPAICRDADGLASGLDPALFAYRQDRLRAVGNGVVPLTAAVAWIELNERIEP